MILGTKHKTAKVSNDAIQIKLDKVTLERVTNTKFLGITIDENFTWRSQISNISKNISKGVGILNKLKHFVPERVLFSLYCTLVLPYINYGILAWGNTCKRNLDRIFKLQKKALRIISKSHYLSHSAPLFKNYNLLNVYDSYELELSTFMYKYFTNQLPKIFRNYFLVNNQGRYHTRKTEYYKIWKTKTQFADKTMRSAGPRKWNNIDENKKVANSVKHFRSQIKADLTLKYI